MQLLNIPTKRRLYEIAGLVVLSKIFTGTLSGYFMSILLSLGRHDSYFNNSRFVDILRGL